MFEYQLLGESHGKAVGVLITHLPAGIEIEKTTIARDLFRRKSTGGVSTSRIEEDEVDYVTGVFQGKTTGEPLLALLYNRDVNDSDYETIKYIPRPGHADLAVHLKNNGYEDVRGGGHYSGRLTAPLTVAGSLAKSYLSEKLKIQISASIVEEEALRKKAQEAKKQGDSIGGQIICTISGVQPGLGGMDLQDCLESELARQMFAIPGVKAIGFGLGEQFKDALGSYANDWLRIQDGKIRFESNHSGGINGGITNGQDIVFTLTFRPTPSIAKAQHSIRLDTMENTELQIHGRHDSCIVLRACPVVEAVAALAISRYLEADDLMGRRLELDRIDDELGKLLKERFVVSKEIGQLKKEQGLPVYDRQREQKILEKRRECAGDFSHSIENVYKTILQESKEQQS